MNQVRLRRQVGSPLPTTFGLLVAGMPDPQPCTRLGFRSQCGSIEALFDWLVEMAAQGVQKMLVSVGESLIDLVQQGQDESGKPLFCAHEGGSPFNVAIAMARLGASVGFLCPSSTDAFGIQLRARLAEAGVANLCSRPVAAPTALAVVSTDATGHPSYAFHRQGTADRTLDPIRLCEALPESWKPCILVPWFCHRPAIGLPGVPSFVRRGSRGFRLHLIPIFVRLSSTIVVLRRSVARGVGVGGLCEGQR